MAELSKIRKNGVDYDIKDSIAREAIEELKQNGTGGNIGQSAVLFTEQTLTEEQKAQARENIGSASQEQVDILNELVLPKPKAEITVIGVDNQVLNKLNNLVSINGCWCRYTNMIPVSSGDRFTLIVSSTVDNNSFPNILWFDGSENVIGTETHSIDTGCLLVTVPETACYVRFTDSGYGAIAELTENHKIRFEVLHAPRADEADNREVIITERAGCMFGDGNAITQSASLSAKRTNPITIFPGDVFYLSSESGKGKAIWYGENGARLSVQESNAASMELYPPDGAVLVRFQAYAYNTDPSKVVLSVSWKSDDKTLEYLQSMNYLWGKKYVACGDSFTAGDFATKTDETWDEATQEYKTYCWHIANRNRMELVNEAKSGSTMYNNGDANAFSVNRYKQIPADADYITLCFGLNDQTYGGAMGTLEDATNATVIGAWNVVLEYLITNMPYAKIGIIIADAYTNTTMRDAIVSVAKHWGIPYLDLKGDPKVPLLIGGRFSDNPVCAKAVELRNAAFQISAADSHPNPKAHAYRSTIIENFMRSL